MTQASSLFLVIAATTAVLNWVAVAQQARLLEYITKPSATLAFLLTAATLDVPHDASWKWRLAALAFCIAGDVFLMLPKDAFIPGLASFAVGQILFTISFVSQGVDAAHVYEGILVVALVSTYLLRRFLNGIRSSGHAELVPPVIAYMLVISAMAISAVGTNNYVAMFGAAIFMASDSLIAETRFVKSKPWHGVAIMVTYHLALAGLVLSLL